MTVEHGQTPAILWNLDTHAAPKQPVPVSERLVNHQRTGRRRRLSRRPSIRRSGSARGGVRHLRDSANQSRLQSRAHVFDHVGQILRAQVFFQPVRHERDGRSAYLGDVLAQDGLIFVFAS